MNALHVRLSWSLTLLVGAAACTNVTEPETTLFSDDFQNGLAQWSGRPTGHHAQVVDDPLNPGNAVVSFTRTVAAGDLFSVPIPVAVGEEYTLSFDYLGLVKEASQPGNLGGFIGISDDKPGVHFWLYGPKLNPAEHLYDLTEDGRWHSYTVRFVPAELFAPTEGTIRIMLEDGEGELSVPGDAYFDNVRLTQR